MDFSVISLDDNTAKFHADLCSWLDEHATEEMIEANWCSGDGHNVEFHKALGARGWAFPSLSNVENEAENGTLARQVFELELARRHVPSTSRSTTAIVLPAVEQWMHGALRDNLLTAVARGEVCFCLGYTEPATGSDLAAVRTLAVLDGDEWILNGQKMFTTGAHLCQYCFLIARTDRDVPKHKGLTTFLVPLNTAGIEITEVQTLGGERTNMVFLDDVRVSDDFRVGPVGQGWEVINGPLNAEHQIDNRDRPIDEQPGEGGMGAAVDMSGHIISVHESAVRSAVDWANVPAANGMRPLDDPVVRQRLAEVELGLVVSKLTPGAHGRVIAADLFIHNSAELVDLLGPSALLPRDEPSCICGGWVEYANRFAQACAIYGGTTEVVRNLIGNHFLGMGRVRAKTKDRISSGMLPSELEGIGASNAGDSTNANSD